MISELRIDLGTTNVAHLAHAATQKGLKAFGHATFIEVHDGRRSIRLAQSHLVYCWDIINNFDYYFDAVRPETFEDTLVVDYSSGRYHDVNGFDMMPVYFA